MQLILASQSRARKNMLQAAGLNFECCPANLDEGSIIEAQERKSRSPAEIATVLAEGKARFVARENRDALVIGADQILECDGKILSKAKTSEEARDKLRYLRGKTHRLISAVALVHGDNVLWHECTQACLDMRDFDDKFLEHYCAHAGKALTRSVGAYELESLGVQLFDKIDGDYFTILGMPLLELLHALRVRTQQGTGL